MASIAISPIISFAEERSAVASGDKPDPKTEEMMKKMEAAGTPRAAHKILAKLIGEWAVEVKYWMTPEGEPTVTKGTSTAKWIMGDRFLHEEFYGEMMGKPFQGKTIMGYDNTSKMYNTVWIDNMSTGMVVSEGTANKDDAKMLTYTGECACPVSKEMTKKFKHILHIVSDDKHVLEMYDLSKGEKFKEMESNLNPLFPSSPNPVIHEPPA